MASCLDHREPDLLRPRIFDSRTVGQRFAAGGDPVRDDRDTTPWHWSARGVRGGARRPTGPTARRADHLMLHPIRILDRVIEEYREYLLTEFRAKDPALKEALERELDRPRFLAQEPFFQAHRPFRSGRRWRELPIDPRLAGVMERRAGNERAWRHQSEAIERLLDPAPGPLVVTTGTGSGKTEAFLLPVIQRAIE